MAGLEVTHPGVRIKKQEQRDVGSRQLHTRIHEQLSGRRHEQLEVWMQMFHQSAAACSARRSQLATEHCPPVHAAARAGQVDEGGQDLYRLFNFDINVSRNSSLATSLRSPELQGPPEP